MDWQSMLPMLLVGGGSSALLIFLIMKMMDEDNNVSANETVQTATQGTLDAPTSTNIATEAAERALLPDGYWYGKDPNGDDVVYKEGVMGPVGYAEDYQDTIATRNEIERLEAESSAKSSENEKGWRMALEYGAAGAGIGAVAGTIVPGIGNAVGAIGGALIGGAIGLGGAAIAEANGGDPWPFW